METAPPLVLHSSIARLVLSYSTPMILLGVGARALVDGGYAIIPATMVVLGLVLAGVVLLDLPLRTEFDSDGCTRVCLLRRDRIEWARVVALERIVSTSRQKRAMRRSTKADDVVVRTPDRGQGLTARLGPRRTTMLVDRRESHAEHAEIRHLLRDQTTMIRATSPPLDAAPAGRGPQALHRRLR